MEEVISSRVALTLRIPFGVLRELGGRRPVVSHGKLLAAAA
jgi:hypothetical protein